MPDQPSYIVAVQVHVPMGDLTDGHALIAGLDRAQDDVVNAVKLSLGDIQVDLLSTTEVLGRELWIAPGVTL